MTTPTRAAAAAKHPHIVTICQVGEDSGVPFLALEMLEGETPESKLNREGTLPLPELARVAREIAEGLAAAHVRGLIHRDVKPSNIWVESDPAGRIKIRDFGPGADRGGRCEIDGQREGGGHAGLHVARAIKQPCEMPHLRTLVLTGTKVSDTGIAEIRKGLPSAKIEKK